MRLLQSFFTVRVFSQQKEILFRKHKSFKVSHSILALPIDSFKSHLKQKIFYKNRFLRIIWSYLVETMLNMKFSFFKYLKQIMPILPVSTILFYSSLYVIDDFLHFLNEAWKFLVNIVNDKIFNVSLFVSLLLSGNIF